MSDEDGARPPGTSWPYHPGVPARDDHRTTVLVWRVGAPALLAVVLLPLVVDGGGAQVAAVLAGLLAIPLLLLRFRPVASGAVTLAGDVLTAKTLSGPRKVDLARLRRVRGVRLVTRDMSFERLSLVDRAGGRLVLTAAPGFGHGTTQHERVVHAAHQRVRAEVAAGRVPDVSATALDVLALPSRPSVGRGLLGALGWATVLVALVPLGLGAAALWRAVTG